MPTITNIAAYRFAELNNLKPLRDRLLAVCKQGQLKGTILLSTEGINCFVAGESAEIETLLEAIRAVPGLEQLEPKYSESREQPFHRMLVKIKREIIPFGVQGIDPARHPAPKLSPRQLKVWLDEGRPITLLDTRNDYEVKLGSFRNATLLDIRHFREFPDAVRKLPETMKQQPIVMFCTGGIRCEKAGPFMQREGYEQVFQLDGGILKYFEDCGDEHFDGDCFVFDQRVGVDPHLHETETTQCFACQTPLSPEEQQDERFVEGRSCPYCYLTPQARFADTLAKRQADLQCVTSPLPGCLPYTSERPLNVPAEFDGLTALDFLTSILGHIPQTEWRRVCDEGRLRKRSFPPSAGKPEDSTAVSADEIVRAGERLIHVQPQTSEPEVSTQIRIIYEDEAILVVHKPAPLPMHPSGRFNRNTLQHFLNQVYHPQSPRSAHRLDANTAGLVLFARTKHFAKRLAAQFCPGSSAGIEKRYLARVHGHPVSDQFTCTAPISDQAGDAGSREIDFEQGLPAHTDFRILHRFRDGSSLLEAIPRTGRTNQIRVHLWYLNHPICGDPTYLPGRQHGHRQTLDLNSPPMCLLAQSLAFTHPLSGKRQLFEIEPADWCRTEDL